MKLLALTTRTIFNRQVLLSNLFVDILKITLLIQNYSLKLVTLLKDYSKNHSYFGTFLSKMRKHI
jgi:hypothetical protein